MMNERIKELALQARQYAWVNETHWSAGPERERLFEQKFAELIVRECMGVADLPNNASGQWDHLLSSEVIGKHFGVEE